MNHSLILTTSAVLGLGLACSMVDVQDVPAPDTVFTLDGSQSEGFAIGSGNTAFNSSPDGSIYKIDLQTGAGGIFVPVVDPQNCTKLGMRVDPRTDYLFVAGCVTGTAMVFDAENGSLLMEYQLGPGGGQSIINDLAITEDAVYFTNARLPVVYRLPLSGDGQLPADASGVEEIVLPPEFEIDNETFCCGGNGIVAMDNGRSLIVGHSNLARLYHVDLDSGEVNPVSVSPPLSGFLDGIAASGRTLYVLTPNGTGGPVAEDSIQVVTLGDDGLTGARERIITDPDLQGVASGAIVGTSLYVNNARYEIFPPTPDTRYWITELEQAVDGTDVITAALSGLWHNPETPGQGIFLDIAPRIDLFFAGWLTWSSTPGDYDWLTMHGDFSGNTAAVSVYRTTGGRFNDPQSVETTPIGVAEFVFVSRTRGQVSIDLDGSDTTIVIPLERVTPSPDR